MHPVPLSEAKRPQPSVLDVVPHVGPRQSFFGTPSGTDPAVRGALEELLRVRVQERAATIGRDLPIFGITKQVTEPERVRSEFGTWYFVNGFTDPTIKTFGGQPIPEQIQEELRALANTGLQLDRIWVAHELPRDWPDDAPLPQLVPDQPRIRRADEFLVKFADAFARGTAAVAKGTALAVAGTGLVVGAAFATAGLDPLVLGGVDHPTESATIWAVLARWDWPLE